MTSADAAAPARPAVDELLAGAAGQRALLRTMRAHVCTPLETAEAWNAFEATVLAVHARLHDPFALVVPVLDEDRDACRRELAAVRTACDDAEALAGCVRALAADPYDPEAQAELARAWERLS
ncbi:hypothetical protein EV189_3245 [Motilibacter rhizosphaerae]|uniref:Uncharacterized protein n=1 Tax=Motilibacter rhizosphaerae TaxID=598652 RepID=A0A4Q7NG17_9ACTN|nr:hypothetical protein [Motilibacter rhizosphaerae]RZS82850.1 hypothetical protein EV189_3245 [Motilibacter rhizosphaerae]